MPAVRETVDAVRALDVDQYKYGFVTDIASEKPARGHSEAIVRYISEKKREPQWMLEGRLGPAPPGLPMCEQKGGKAHYPPIHYDEIYYYSAPKSSPGPK